jgi:hypothetical protein
MGLEIATYINQLVSTNPLGSDQKSQGDDHVRLIKAVLLASFPNIAGAVTPTHTVLNAVQSAANLTSGTLADARLSTNVPLLNASNVFTGSNQQVESAQPLMRLGDSDGGSNAKNWLIYGAPNALRIDTANDAAPNTAVAQALSITRSGTAVTAIDLTATAVNVNGVSVNNAAILTAGALADARVAQSNVTQHQAALALAASQITTGTLAIARGGTAAGDATNARINLGIGSMATRGLTIQSGGSPTGGSDGDIYMIY